MQHTKGKKTMGNSNNNNSKITKAWAYPHSSAELFLAHSFITSLIHYLARFPLKKCFDANMWILRNISNFHFRWCISCWYAFATVISSIQGNKITTCKMQQPYHRNNNTLMQTIFTPQAWLSTFVHLQLLRKPSTLHQYRGCFWSIAMLCLVYFKIPCVYLTLLKAFTVAYVTFRNATYTASTHIGLE